MPLPEQRRKVNAQFEIMSVPYNVVRMDYSRGARHGQNQWQYDNWKAKMQNAMQKRRSMIPSCCDGKMMKGIGPPKQPSVVHTRGVVPEEWPTQAVEYQFRWFFR